MLRRYAGEHRRVWHDIPKLLVAHSLQLRAGHHEIILASFDADLFRDGLRGHRVVPGNHHGANTRSPTFADRVDDLGTRGIHDAVQCQQHEIGFEVLGIQALLKRWQPFVGNGQGTQCVVPEGVHRVLVALATFVVQGHFFAVGT